MKEKYFLVTFLTPGKNPRCFKAGLESAKHYAENCKTDPMSGTLAIYEDKGEEKNLHGTFLRSLQNICHCWWALCFPQELILSGC